MALVAQNFRHNNSRLVISQPTDRPFEQLTAIISADLLRRGEYSPAIVPWLFAGVGIGR